MHPNRYDRGLRIGFVTCVHPIYNLPAVAALRQEAAGRLQALGCEVLVTETPRSASDAVPIASALRAGEIDLAVLFFCTWVAEDITLALASELADVPLLLWALPYLDRDVPMPSPISGLVASASNIRRLGKPFVWMIGSVLPEVRSAPLSTMCFTGKLETSSGTSPM